MGQTKSPRRPCWQLHGLGSYYENLRLVSLSSLSGVTQPVKAEAKEALGLFFILPGLPGQCHSESWKLG